MQRPRLAGACFSRHRGFHAPRSILRETRRMSRAPRFVGYALMGAAVLLALAMRRGALSAIGPFSAVAAALFVGMIGVMLVFTDLMVRGLYAQVDAAKAVEEEDKRSEEHTSELQSLIRRSYAVFCLTKKK